MTGRILSWLATAALLAGAGLLALAMSTVTGSTGNGSVNPDGEGPQIILRGVEMTEARHGGQVYRLVSDSASYAVRSGQALASDVTLVLREKEGNVVVTAPVASWNMNEDRIDLPMGATAKGEAGWTAASPRASVDLRSEVISAEEASLSGPGLMVEGNALRWRWRDGKVELLAPKSNIQPDRNPVTERKG